MQRGSGVNGGIWGSEGQPPRRGFTLIELVVALVIVGILVAIALPNYVKIKDKAREAEAKAALHAIQLELERFAIDNGGDYPEYLNGGEGRTALIKQEANESQVIYILDLPPDQLCDPMLRNGYLVSYPRNPFVRITGTVDKLQRQYGDPLRNFYLDSFSMGTRFGAHNTTMGQVLCDSRWLQWAYTDQETGQVLLRDTWSSIQYEFYDVWLGNLRRPYLSGSFMYKSFGPIVPTAGKMADRDYIVVDGQQAFIPMDMHNQAVYPASLDSYILSVWGGQRTKGLDILGEEPLVLFSYRGSRNRAQARWDFIFNEETGLYELPRPDPVSTVKLLGVPPWTRGVNRSHVGPLWGSPYGPAQSEEQQLSIGNPNGLRDALILVLSAGDTLGRAH